MYTDIFVNLFCLCTLKTITRLIKARVRKRKSNTKQTPNCMDFPGGASGKEPACQCRRYKRCRFNPWVMKIPWRGHVNPFQYSCLENFMDRGSWWPTVCSVTKRWTQLKQLSTHTHTEARRAWSEARAVRISLAAFGSQCDLGRKGRMESKMANRCLSYVCLNIYGYSVDTKNMLEHLYNTGVWKQNWDISYKFLYCEKDFPAALVVRRIENLESDVIVIQSLMFSLQPHGL